MGMGDTESASGFTDAITSKNQKSSTNEKVEGYDTWRNIVLSMSGMKQRSILHEQRNFGYSQANRQVTKRQWTTLSH
ncbi:hypothetical protein JHK86_050168 [Glycine max]|nr:hypothetical protein JHK86_050168 [Glycine max]